MRDEKQVRDQGKGHPNVIGLHAGWVAAREGQPEDKTQDAAWLEGFRLWHVHKAIPGPIQN